MRPRRSGEEERCVLTRPRPMELLHMLLLEAGDMGKQTNNR
jgi:hypothetical protein